MHLIKQIIIIVLFTLCLLLVKSSKTVENMQFKRKRYKFYIDLLEISICLDTKGKNVLVLRVPTLVRKS